VRIQTVAIVVAATSLAIAPATAFPAENPYGGGTRLTGPPPAEIPTGPLSQQDKARVVTQRFAACLIKEHRTSVLKAIQPEPWQPGVGKLLATVADYRCLEAGQLEMPQSLLRGAFYQQLYRETFASGAPTLPATAIDFTAGTKSLPDDAKTDVALRQFGDCVARKDLRDAHALALSSPGSAAESAALRNLMPHFGACVIQGSNWTLNRSSITAILSEVLYREGVAAHQKTTILPPSLANKSGG
jgi:hypothetical protein